MNFAAIDFETANHHRHSACALGLVLVEGGRITAEHSWLIRPPEPRFRFSHIHGITWREVQDAPTFGELWPEIARWLERADFLAAHNAPFDASVLKATCGYYGITPPELPFRCTVRLARNRLGIRPTNLPSVCAALGIDLGRHHDALNDARACALIMLEIWKRASSRDEEISHKTRA